PLARSFGTTVAMNATLFGGATVRPLVEWDPGRALSLMEDEAVTVFHGVPAMYADLTDHPDADDDSSLRLATVGDNGVPTDLLRDVETQFDVTLYEGYGRTEAGPVTHANDPERGRRVGSVGRPIDGVRAMVVDGEFEERDPVPEGPLDPGEDRTTATGEIVVAGPGVMAGYRAEAATEAAFTVADDGGAVEDADGDASGTRWFHTGDLGYRDEDGYYYIVGRRDDRIVTGGYEVAPREVETLLAEHDGVADAAVVGVPDGRRGETVAAYVVRTPGADVDAEGISDYCLSNLAAYKHPRTVEFVDELPRTETGAIDRGALRERGPVAEAVAEAVAAGTERPAGRTELAATSAPAEGVDEADAGPESDGVDGEDPGLRDLDGISEHRAEALQEAGYGSVPDLRDASHDELAAIEGFGDALASRIKQQVDHGPAGGE
ncbi:MAG: AMP-binding protein, partial [Halobacteriales archaeon]